MRKNFTFFIILLTVVGAILGLILSQFYPIFHPFIWGQPFDSYHIKIMPYYIFPFALLFFIFSFFINKIIKAISIKNALSFLKKDDIKNIEKAIKEVESKTSGEIRIHISSDKSIDDCFEAARKCFYRLKMQNTKDRNGILLFIAPNARKFAIFGDEGINKVIKPGFWDNVKDILEDSFKKNNFSQGIIKALYEVGEVLQKFFPIKGNDKNELSNKVDLS